MILYRRDFPELQHHSPQTLRTNIDIWNTPIEKRHQQRLTTKLIASFKQSINNISLTGISNKCEYISDKTSVAIQNPNLYRLKLGFMLVPPPCSNTSTTKSNSISRIVLRHTNVVNTGISGRLDAHGRIGILGDASQCFCKQDIVLLDRLESAAGVVVTTSVCHAVGKGSIPGTDSCDITIWLSTSLVNRRITLMSVPSQFGT